jgi:hypothetical protein
MDGDLDTFIDAYQKARAKGTLSAAGVGDDD